MILDKTNVLPGEYYKLYLQLQCHRFICKRERLLYLFDAFYILYSVKTDLSAEKGVQVYVLKCCAKTPLLSKKNGRKYYNRVSRVFEFAESRKVETGRINQ